MMRRRTFIATVIGPSALVLAAACAQPAAAPTALPAKVTTPTKVVISFSDRTTSDLALFLAKAVDLFGKYGVDADLQFIASSTGIAALVSDQTQFALIGGPETLGAAVGGADLVASVQLSGAQPYLMEGTRSSQTLVALRG